MAILTFEGGINNQDVSLVDPIECIEGWNFELGATNSHFQGRKPFDLKGTATNASAINGFVQLIKNDDTETTLVQAGDTVYTWNGSSTFTSKGTVNSGSRLRGTTWGLGGYSVITDISKLTVVKKWEGTTLSTLTTGLGATDLYAKYGMVHLGRVWLFNVKAGTDTPHLLVASAFENPESYDITKRAKDSSFTTGNEAFFMVTPDLKPINGVALWYDTLIISTEKGLIWKLSGSNSKDFTWSPLYPDSYAIGTETMANIGDDVVYMRKDGVIESLRSTDRFGDVGTDDLSRFVKSITSDLTDCKTIYDQSKQKVYFFCGSNKLLVLFKDMMGTKLSPWSLYKTNHSSAFVTNASIYMRRPGASNYFVYFGDSAGNIYQFEGTGSGDSGTTAIDAYRKTTFFEELERQDGTIINPYYDILRGRVYYRRIADADLFLDIEWADDYKVQRNTIPLNGPPVGDSTQYFGGSIYWGGTYYFNSGFQFTNRISTKGFSSVGRGPGFYIQLTVNSLQQFDIQKIEI